MRAGTCSVGIMGTAACKSFMTREVYLSCALFLRAKNAGQGRGAPHVRAPMTRHASCAATLPAGIMLAAEKYLQPAVRCMRLQRRSAGGQNAQEIACGDICSG